MDDSKADKSECRAVFETNVNNQFNSVLKEPSVSNHKNPIVKVWNNLKALINNVLSKNFLNLGNTGRQDKIMGAQRELKTKFQELQKGQEGETKEENNTHSP